MSHSPGGHGSSANLGNTQISHTSFLIITDKLSTITSPPAAPAIFSGPKTGEDPPGAVAVFTCYTSSDSAVKSIFRNTFFKLAICL